MMNVWLLLLSANLVGGATFGRGAHLRSDEAKMFRGSRSQQDHNVTTGGQQLLGAGAEQTPPMTTSFRQYYDTHAIGRGIWKWANAIDAYDRHFGGWAYQQVKLAEVGVQSGGSIEMWQGGLGQQIHVYGFDINTNCRSFANTAAIGGVTITIGDQANPQMWKSFFQTTPALDVLIDDGGHEFHQMLTTLYEVYPHINSGGFLVIEDIHGPKYMAGFFAPAAQYIGQQAIHGLVDSVHVYPFLLIVQKGGPNPPLPAHPLQFTVGAVVDSFEALWAAMPMHLGAAIELRNPGWGPFLTGTGINNFFATFAGLHDYDMFDTPPGCAKTAAAICTAAMRNSAVQNSISGIHIYNDRLVVEVAKRPPLIQAVRKGTQFIGYGL